MYEYPNSEGHLTAKEAINVTQQMNLHPLHIQKLEEARHIFSHVEWHMTGYMIRVDSLTREESDLLFVEIQNARENYPIPSAFYAFSKYLN